MQRVRARDGCNHRWTARRSAVGHAALQIDPKAFRMTPALPYGEGGDSELKPPLKHGFARPGKEAPEYRAWAALRNRCSNPNHDAYKNYGGRGIKVCERWNDFLAFLEDMGPRPSPKHSIDRINNDGNYEPDNCRWATRSEQCRNMRAGTQGKSPIKGVSWDSFAKKWRAQIRNNKLRIRTGYFSTEEEAAAARKALEEKYWANPEPPSSSEPSVERSS